MKFTEAVDYLNNTLRESILAKEQMIAENLNIIIETATEMKKALNRGNKILIFGNGGSAADAQHMAAELVGRMLIERAPKAAIALTTDTSIITAIGNDYGFEEVFSRQILGLAKSGDVVVAISTSGNSINTLLGVEAAKIMGCKVISLTGNDGGKLAKISDIPIIVSKGKNSCRIQEAHIFAIHSIVDLIDRMN